MKSCERCVVVMALFPVSGVEITDMIYTQTAGLDAMMKYVVIAIILVIGPGSFVAADVFVSPDGSDKNIGAESSPVASLQRARDLIRQQRQAGTITPHSNATVWIEGGSYEVKQAFVLNEQDSHTTYRAKVGATVNIIGGHRIPAESFQRVTDSTILRRLASNSARENIVQADLRALGITDYGKLQRYGHMLPVVSTTGAFCRQRSSAAC